MRRIVRIRWMACEIGGVWDCSHAVALTRILLTILQRGDAGRDVRIAPERSGRCGSRSQVPLRSAFTLAIRAPSMSTTVQTKPCASTDTPG